MVVLVVVDVVVLVLVEVVVLVVVEVEVLVEVVVLVEVEVVVLVVPGAQMDWRHSPVIAPAKGGDAQGQSAGQSPPIQPAPSHVLTQGEPHPGVVVVGGGPDGGGQGQFHVPHVQ